MQVKQRNCILQLNLDDFKCLFDFRNTSICYGDSFMHDINLVYPIYIDVYRCFVMFELKCLYALLLDEMK